MSKQASEQDIERLESKLGEAFRPVEPSEAYRHYLHDRLVIPPSELQIQMRTHSPWQVILAAIGLTGGVILLITSIKILVNYSQTSRKRMYPRSYA